MKGAWPLRWLLPSPFPLLKRLPLLLPLLLPSCSVIRDMIADSSVTENNMMQFLGVIEQRVNEILQVMIATRRRSHGVDPFHSFLSSLFLSCPPLL